MSTPLGEVHLITSDDQAIVLRRAYLPSSEQVYDVAAFRAPFGQTWHRVGTGLPLVTHVSVTGHLEGADREASIALRDAALELLPDVVKVAFGDWTAAVEGVTGATQVSSTEHGYRLTATFIAKLEQWQAVA